MITRDEILETLNEYKQKNQSKYQIHRIGVFGSTARDQTKGNSDIDVVVELGKQDLFFLIGIKQDLEASLQSHVDIVSYRKNMNAYLKTRIDDEAVYV